MNPAIIFVLLFAYASANPPRVLRYAARQAAPIIQQTRDRHVQGAPTIGQNQVVPLPTVRQSMPTTGLNFPQQLPAQETHVRVNHATTYSRPIVYHSPSVLRQSTHLRGGTAFANMRGANFYNNIPRVNMLGGSAGNLRGFAQSRGFSSIIPASYQTSINRMDSGSFAPQFQNVISSSIPVGINTGATQQFGNAIFGRPITEMGSGIVATGSGLVGLGRQHMIGGPRAFGTAGMQGVVGAHQFGSLGGVQQFGGQFIPLGTTITNGGEVTLPGMGVQQFAGGRDTQVFQGPQPFGIQQQEFSMQAFPTLVHGSSGQLGLPNQFMGNARVPMAY